MKILSRPKLIQKYPRVFAVFALALGIFSLAAIMLNSVDWELIADERAIRDISISDDIRQIATDLGLNRKGKAVLFAAHPKMLKQSDFNKSCNNNDDYSYASGCYHKDNDGREHIDIFDTGVSTLNENGINFDFIAERNTTVLHETLHAVWERRSDDEQSALCNDLMTIYNQIPRLQKVANIYNRSVLCTELFARVGSEYMSLEASQTTLNNDGKSAFERLSKTYEKYFDTSKTERLLAHWHNQTQLEEYSTDLDSYKAIMSEKYRTVLALKTAYYARPSIGNYYITNQAIKEYNAMVVNYNTRLGTINKIYAVLDSEQEVSS